METLDELCGKCKCLREEEFNILLGALKQEKERRENAEKKEDWANLCKTIENFIAKWGSIAVYEREDYITNVVVHLRRGEFTFPEFGEIEVS